MLCGHWSDVLLTYWPYWNAGGWRMQQTSPGELLQCLQRVFSSCREKRYDIMVTRKWIYISKCRVGLPFLLAPYLITQHFIGIQSNTFGGFSLEVEATIAMLYTFSKLVRVHLTSTHLRLIAFRDALIIFHKTLVLSTASEQVSGWSFKLIVLICLK